MSCELLAVHRTPVGTQDTCQASTQFNALALLVAQWREHPPGVQDVRGSIPVGDLFASVVLISSLFTI